MLENSQLYGILKLVLKFEYSEKATKFEKKIRRQIVSGRFFSNFVAFSEYPNFTKKINLIYKVFGPITM